VLVLEFLPKRKKERKISGGMAGWRGQESGTYDNILAVFYDSIK